MRRIVVIAGASGAAIAAAVACGFPAVEIASGSDAGATSDSGVAPHVDGAVPGPLPDGSCIGSDPTCDCDDDGDKKPSCGGHDCNDSDSRYKTGGGFVDAEPPPGGGDWNCDGKVEKELDAGIQCATVLDGGIVLDLQAAKTTCANAQGFQSDVGCGQPGRIVYCQLPTSVDARKCVEKTHEDRPRGCR